MTDSDGLTVPLDAHIGADGPSAATQPPPHLQQPSNHIPHAQVQAHVAAVAAATSPGVSVGVPNIAAAVATNPSPAATPNSVANPRRGKQYKCGFCHELGHNRFVSSLCFLSSSTWARANSDVVARSNLRGERVPPVAWKR